MSTCGVVRSRRSRWFAGALSAVAVAVGVWSPRNQVSRQAHAAPPSDGDSYVALLAQQSIAPTVDGIVAHLKTLTPDVQARQRAKGLIEQLGNDAYARREEAARQLGELPV